MATKTAIICDVCSREKKDVNHWFIISIGKDEEGEDPGFHIIQADKIKREHMDDEAKDVCGQACATKLFSKWMTDANTAEKAEILDDTEVQEMPIPISIKE